MATRNALTRSEPAALFSALETAAKQCDDNAKKAFVKRFREVLPVTPKKALCEYDARFRDTLVELAAYGWLRKEQPQAKLELVPRANSKTPDLRLLLNERVMGIECKNIHWLRGTDREQYGKGGFRDKLVQVISEALQQLQGYEEKIIFLNYSPSHELWAEEEVPVEGVEDSLEAEFTSVPHGDARLLVFQNYDWTKPRFRSDPLVCGRGSC